MTGETEYYCALCNIKNTLLKSNLTAVVFLIFNFSLKHFLFLTQWVMNTCFQIQQHVVCCTPSEAEGPMHWTLPNEFFCHYFTVRKGTLWWQWLFYSKEYRDDIFRRCSWTGQLMQGEISWVFVWPMVSVSALTPQHTLPSPGMDIGKYLFCHMWFPFMS